jgi:hypothetical protein
MLQLDLLTYQPTAEEMASPTPKPQPVNLHAIAWQETKAACYLSLMRRFMRGSLCSQAVRSHEIERLHQLRQECLRAIEEVNRG